MAVDAAGNVSSVGTEVFTTGARWDPLQAPLTGWSTRRATWVLAVRWTQGLERSSADADLGAA